MPKTIVERFIVSKPWNVGKFNRTFPAGTVIEVDNSQDLFIAEGKEFKGLKELSVAMGIKDKKTGVALVLPFSEKSAVVRSILDSVKTRIAEKEVAVQKYKVIQSDTDLVDTIDCSAIKVPPKAKVSSKDKTANLNVIQESEISLPGPKKGSSPEELEKRVNALNSPLKLKIVKETEAHDLDHTLSGSAKVKVRAMPLAGTRKGK